MENLQEAFRGEEELDHRSCLQEDYLPFSQEGYILNIGPISLVGNFEALGLIYGILGISSGTLS